MNTAAAVAVASPRFHIPFEHGAWWSFGSTLVASLGLALALGVDARASLGLALSLAAGFVAQDWGQALIAAVLRRRSQAVSQWQAWQGWVLAALSAFGAGLLLLRRPASERGAWVALFALLALGAGLGLLSRVLQSGRGRRSLAVTALLLALPALPFGVLCFGFSAKAAAFWAWPLLYYPAATLAAQSYIRGLDAGLRYAGPALALGLGLAAAFQGALLPCLVLLAQAARLGIAIRRRWALQPSGLPGGDAIRAFGREQAFFGVALTLCWAWSFR